MYPLFLKCNTSRGRLMRPKALHKDPRIHFFPNIISLNAAKYNCCNQNFTRRNGLPRADAMRLIPCAARELLRAAPRQILTCIMRRRARLREVVDLLRRTILTLALLTLLLTAGSAFAGAGAELYPFYDGQAYRLMDSNGDMLSDLSCDYISAIQLDDGQKRFVAFMSDENGSRAVLLDAKGQPLTDQDYESIYYQDGALMTVKNGLCGIIDENGDELLPAR